MKPARIDKMWSDKSYPGCPIIQRSSKDITSTQIKRGGQTNIQNNEPAKSSTPTCVKPMMDVQNNPYTFAHLPRLVTTHAQQSIKGTLGRANIKKQGTKLTPKQKPARIDKTKSEKTYKDCPSTPRPKIQTSIMDFISKGKKRLNTVQLTAVENKKTEHQVNTNR